MGPNVRVVRRHTPEQRRPVHRGLVKHHRARRASRPVMQDVARPDGHDGRMPETGTHHHAAVLDGVMERVTFANAETGYTIARVDAGRGADLVTVVGPLLGAQVGECLRMRGRWTSHPKYGKQFEVHSYTTVLPATVQGIQRYLGSGLIKGIGPVMAERMVAHFGVDIMHIIEDSPGRLIEVDGLGPKRTAMITAAWAEQKAIKEVMIFLQGVGVSTSLAVRIYKKYGDASISVVRSEPYRLASDVWGIGFKTADTIAAAVGIARDSPERIKAGLAYTLSEAADDGHCYLPAPNLTGDAAKILDIPAELISPCLDELTATEGVIRETVPSAAALTSARPHRTFPPSTCRLSIRPNGPWLTPCCACLPPAATGCPDSRPSTGTRHCAGYAAGPGPRSRPSKRTRCGSPSRHESRCSPVGRDAASRSPCVQWWSWRGPRGRRSCWLRRPGVQPSVWPS